MKLEFAKMTVRTKTLDIMARVRKKTNLELKELNKDIVTNTRLPSTETDELMREILIRELEQATSEKM
jgi:hypothetical protein